MNTAASGPSRRRPQRLTQRARRCAGLVVAALAAGALPSAPSAASPVGVSLASHGGNCDGATDNFGPITRALNEARRKGMALLLPAGQCNYSDVIRIDGAAMTGQGDATVLYATDWRRSAIFMSGAGPRVSSLKLAGQLAPSRQAQWEATRITVFGATDFVIDNVTVEGSSAAGFQTAQAPTRGRITNNRLRNTLSDAIHMTDGASFIVVDNNTIDNAGDDGIAVVSYQRDGRKVSHITARNNVVRNNKWGRNMSVVGGSDVLYSNNLLQGNASGFACLYLAQEASYQTYGVNAVTAQFNTMENCGSHFRGHGAIMVFSHGAFANDDVWILRNDIRLSGQTGIRVFGPNTHVRLEANRIRGAWPVTSIATPGVLLSRYVDGQVGYVSP